MKNPVYVNTIIYCCILTLIITFLFYAISGLSVYTIASLLSGIIVAFFNLLEEEVIHKKIHDKQ